MKLLHQVRCNKEKNMQDQGVRFNADSLNYKNIDLFQSHSLV